MKLEIDKKRLQEGQQLYFDNSAYQESIGDDMLRAARVWHDSNLPSWANGYKIHFNGVLLHSSKTFKSMVNRLNKLIDTWNLELIEIDENLD